MVTLPCKWLMSFMVRFQELITAIMPSGGTRGEIAVLTSGGRVQPPPGLP